MGLVTQAAVIQLMPPNTNFLIVWSLGVLIFGMREGKLNPGVSCNSRMSANNKYQMENDEEEDQIFEPHSEVTDLLLTSEFESNAELVPKVLIPQRVILTILLCIGVIIMYLQRVTLSIAIIPISDDNNWDHTTQGIVLCSFFAGYMATQIPGGWLAKRYGGKVLPAFSNLISSACYVNWSVGKQYCNCYFTFCIKISLRFCCSTSYCWYYQSHRF